LGSGRKGGGGGGAAAACLCSVQPEAACLLEAASAAGNLFIAPHNTRALGGAALAGQGPVNDTAQARRGPSRRATDGGSLSCARGRSHHCLHVASVHKLLKLLLYVRGRLAHWAAVGVER